MRWRKVFLRVFADIAIYDLIFVPTLIFWTGCIMYFDVHKALEDVRTKFWAAYLAAFGYYSI
jgi:hypothetical protein